MTKRYETKVCHFSHYPDRHGNRAVCNRTANGVDSADHLFIKLHVTRWLADQGHAARSELRSLGHGPGDAVDFWLRATEQHLRFELHPEDYRNWRKAADSLGAKEGHIEWVFGPDGAITRDMVARQGYALRVRCETEGNDRCVLIGTVADNRTVTWAPLDQCRMSSSGLVTPALEELRAEGIIREGGMRNDPLPGSLPLRGAEIVFAMDGEAAPPAESPFASAGRHLVSGFVKPAGSRIIRAHLSLPEEIPVPTEKYVYRLSGAVRLLITDPVEGKGPLWAVRADSLTQLNGLDAERTGLWRPSVAIDERLDRGPRTPRPRTDAAPAQPERSSAATVLRQALERVAREGTTTTWHELARRIGLDLAHLPDPKRRDLLVEVDKPLSADRPLLCVLILAGSGRPLPYLGTVLRLLGAAAPASDAALRRWSETAIKKAHEVYGEKPTPTATAFATPRQEPVTEEQVPSRADLLTASRKLVTIRAKLREAAAVLPRASGRRATRLSQTIDQGEAHARQHFDARRQRHTLRAWLNACDPILDELDRLVGRQVAAPPPVNQPTASGNGSHQPAQSSGGGPKSATGVEQGVHDRQIESARRVARVSELFVAATISDDLAEVRKLRQEAEKISDHDLAGAVRDRLDRLRTDMREWIDARESERAHDAPSVDDAAEAAQLIAFAEARAEFDWLVQEICVAQETEDLAAVETARRLAGPVYARRLSSIDREEFTAFMREVKAWCRERDPEKRVDPALRKIRQLLANLGRTSETRSSDELANALDEVGILRRQLAQPLPAAEDRAVKRWRRRLKDWKPAKREPSAPTAPIIAPHRVLPQQTVGQADSRPADRLPIETIDKLATSVREILADSARSGGRLLTWGELRLRMGGALPHLHPDDQGELLVTVDRETPADEPLLSTLIASADASLHWLYRHVRFSLGRERIPASDLEAHWATEVLRLRQIWRYR
ncbi:hypothetical protein RGF97_17715 [Streptomyces roseicoloratus]|uniref:Uncharacterized protein n=1 Tax=Streptomyces roseicoloratus TaxID=2508722 RepID=A0ABY9RX44_9ACTN|nr:hypothetical protein [Streptomyces roseicoloratus]WMX46313.1 hypothetical protein RGF97_17715 [Streptomyces roseicoloratus]